jgi:hypothetical protein
MHKSDRVGKSDGLISWYHNDLTRPPVDVLRDERVAQPPQFEVAVPYKTAEAHGLFPEQQERRRRN